MATGFRLWLSHRKPIIRFYTTLYIIYIWLSRMTFSENLLKLIRNWRSDVTHDSIRNNGNGNTLHHDADFIVGDCPRVIYHALGTGRAIKTAESQKWHIKQIILVFCTFPMSSKSAGVNRARRKHFLVYLVGCWTGKLTTNIDMFPWYTFLWAVSLWS